MPEWVIWLIVAAALGVGEVVSLSFFLGPIALAATLAAAVAAVGGGVELQFAAFIVAAIATLGIVRPIARRHLRVPGQLRTGAAALIGSRAVVLERVDADGGRVRLGGEVWSARAFDEDDVMEPGARVDVLKIDGATALVSN